eukprot:CAMPEP_0184691362 /NCGR_PEP_ID=MMETSP0313-20130426/246_1 /TAXON_ID=2792 /ORGANISM="Porphyridium aerugineum, Strain SAG 1380-2" /LENGTH=177 /DNA_ID=CAMNT_0027149061 /DNA_START=352 /DNA_END=885 /DNA_ORIENTATION=+
MESEQKCGCLPDLSGVTHWGNIGLSGYFLVVGIISLVNIFTGVFGSVIASPLGFIMFLYIILFGGIFLFFGEMDWPESFVRLFLFLRGSFLRALFILFVASLALTIGFTGKSSSWNNILLIIGGIVAVILGLFTFLWGRDYAKESEMSAEGTGASSSGGLFGGKKSSGQVASSMTAI